jgi:hypothetical protein
MKRIVICVAALVLTGCMVWAFSGNMLLILGYHPPPRLLPEEQAGGGNHKPSSFEVLAIPGERVAVLGEDGSLSITVTAKIKHAV